MPEQIQHFISHLPAFIGNLLLAACALVTGLLIKGALALYLRKSPQAPPEHYSMIRSIMRRLGRPVNYFLPILVLNMVIPLMTLGSEEQRLLSKIVEVSLIVSFGYILIGAVKVFEDYIMHAYDLRKSDNLRERKIRTQLQFLRKLSISVIVILVVCAVLLSFDNLRKIGTGLLTGVGVGGIIVGFAAQRSLGNFLAGLQIAFTQPIRIDDVLVVEGEWGRVEEITLTYVVVGIWDQRKLILPINYFIEKPFQNWTRTGSAILGTVFLYLDYAAPIEALRAEFSRLVEDHPLWDKRVKVLQITNTTEQTMEVRLLVSASNSGRAFDLRCDLREKMIAFIKEKYPESLPRTRASIEKEPE
ncbi:mechanosensitive ion channel family protein [Chitinophaga japonensis]|uniref:Small-conductance mechanosensitive channel n=1 Tax=Chitinophaga japonensis TaxID=104662 RepID=A0A562T109_CHIJA|nr:mechanosensitive ion channel domain-containing protein [Chitinophaga japonensis]TWI86983.1 small-conductance mechanosensitive channel [Chitinophaga japonensis]